MLIPFIECYNILEAYDMKPTGIIHIGAHECEELDTYLESGISKNRIYWIDAMQEKVDLMKSKGIPNVFCAALDNKEHIVKFNITNFSQSSSLLELGTHEQSYPSIRVVESREVKTQTLNNFIRYNNIDISGCNFWALDIQGKELDVLKGADEYIRYADAIYCEVNIQEVYKGCSILSDLDAYLEEKGFIRIKLELTSEGWGDALYIRNEKRERIKMSKMTVAITTMNRYSGFLEKTLPKLLEMPQVDVVLIGDETGEDIERIKLQPWGLNPKFVFIANKERLGAYHNKLNLLRNVTTEWVALIDSDNELLAEYFDALFNYWSENSVNSKSIYMPAAVNFYFQHSGESFCPIEKLSGISVDILSWNTFLNINGCEYALNLGNTVLPRDAWMALSESYQKDLYTECKIMNRDLVKNGYTLVFVPNMKYIHVIHDDSLYLSKSSEMANFNMIYDWKL